MDMDIFRSKLGRIIPLMLSTFMAISVIEASARESGTKLMPDISTKFIDDQI